MENACYAACSTCSREEAVRHLCNLGPIERDPHGRSHQSDTVLTADAPVVPPALRNFTAHMLMLCREALYTVDRKERHISGMTLGISEQMYHLLLAEIEAFKDRVKSLVTRDRNSDRVYQLNLSFIPVSRPPANTVFTSPQTT